MWKGKEIGEQQCSIISDSDHEVIFTSKNPNITNTEAEESIESVEKCIKRKFRGEKI